MTAHERHQPVTPGEGQKSVPFHRPQQFTCPRFVVRVQSRARKAEEKTEFWSVVQEGEPIG